ncbi:hypothetical protein DEJ36_06980 [Curtobacterium sp. MCPF17_052]|nr:hypothetical protein [Curtobacterium sp. MCPF17_052]WIB13504.1 hypothetical protein DEJ36_06980 [Curtobacterium sp. MCPF17_052]
MRRPQAAHESGERHVVDESLRRTAREPLDRGGQDLGVTDRPGSTSDGAEAPSHRLAGVAVERAPVDHQDAPDPSERPSESVDRVGFPASDERVEPDRVGAERGQRVDDEPGGRAGWMTVRRGRPAKRCEPRYRSAVGSTAAAVRVRSARVGVRILGRVPERPLHPADERVAAAVVRQRPPATGPEHSLVRRALVDPDVSDLRPYPAVPTVQDQERRRGVAQPDDGQGPTAQVHRQFRDRCVRAPVGEVLRTLAAIDRPGAVLAAHELDPGRGEHPVGRVPDGLTHHHVRDPPDDVRVGLEGGESPGVRDPPGHARSREVVVVGIVSLVHASQCRPDRPGAGAVPANCGQPPGRTAPVQGGRHRPPRDPADRRSSDG